MAFENFNTVTAKKPYAYRPHPLHGRAFIILRQNTEQGGYMPVGDYTVLDAREEMSLTEKKVMNLIALMNDEDDRLIDLRGQSPGRVLYYRAPTDDPKKTRIIFYVLGEQGVSTENAVLSLEEELQDDQNQ